MSSGTIESRLCSTRPEQWLELQSRSQAPLQTAWSLTASWRLTAGLSTNALNIPAEACVLKLDCAMESGSECVQYEIAVYRHPNVNLALSEGAPGKH